MAVILINNFDDCHSWATNLRRLAPHMDLRIWPECGNKQDIRHAILCYPESGVIKQFPNLIALHSLWAGIDHIIQDPELPKNIPILRMIDESLNQSMLDYVTGHVYRYHLNTPFFEIQQEQKLWKHIEPPLATERQIGVMGLGVLGSRIANQLAYLGFQVSGWSRNQKDLPNITCYTGPANLNKFLEKSEILVVLLPNTPETKNILNKDTFAALPKGATIINVGRGSLINETDLIKALDQNYLKSATLDVFKEEPLPTIHPFWAHPKITVTPHIAATTRAKTASPVIIHNITHLDAGGKIEDLPGVFDAVAGY